MPSVTVLCESGQIYTGTSSSTRVSLSGGDTLTIYHDMFSAASSITVSGFSSGVWTATNSVTINDGSVANKTVVSSPTTGNLQLTVTATGYTTNYIYLYIAPSTPPTSASKPNPFTVSSLSNLEPSAVVYFDTVDVTGNTASATSRVSGGAYQRKSPTGTWTTSDLTVVSGDRVYLKGQAPSTYSSSNSYSLSIGDLSGSNGIGYDWETATFAATTKADPGAGQTINFPITSGQIDLGTVINFFAGYNVGYGGYVPDNSMGDFYRGGDHVPNVTGNNGIPTSGTILMTDFYGSETRWFISAPTSVFREIDTTTGQSSYTTTITYNPAYFFGGYSPGAKYNTEYRNQSVVQIFQSNGGASALSITGGSSTYTSTWNLTVSMTTPANTEREFYGYIPYDARSRWDTSVTSSGRIYFWIFFYGP